MMIMHAVGCIDDGSTALHLHEFLCYGDEAGEERSAESFAISLQAFLHQTDVNLSPFDLHFQRLICFALPCREVTEEEEDPDVKYR